MPAPIVVNPWAVNIGGVNWSAVTKSCTTFILLSKVTIDTSTLLDANGFFVNSSLKTKQALIQCFYWRSLHRARCI